MKKRASFGKLMTSRAACRGIAEGDAGRA